MSYFTEQIYGFCQEYGNMELPLKLEEIASDLFADSMGCNEGRALRKLRPVYNKIPER